MGTSNKDYEKVLKKLRKIYGITNAYNSFEEQVCNYLVKSKYEFDRKYLYKFISDYIKDKIPYNRIMLFKIYTFISSLNDSDNNVLLENLEDLLRFTNDNIEAKDDETNKVIKKLYDYIYLANLQDEKVRKIFDNNIEKANNDLETKIREEIEPIVTNTKVVEERIKSSEKNYITILGIFASFVVTFVGMLSFTESVLKEMSKVSTYRLFVVILLLGFILLTICFSLYWFIARIVNKDDIKGLKNIYKVFVVVIVLLLAVCGVCWFFDKNIKELRNEWNIDKKNETNIVLDEKEEFVSVPIDSEIAVQIE